MQTLSIYWSRSKALKWSRSTKLIWLFGAAILYFVAAHWLTITFTPDPNFAVGPDVAGEKIRLMPPFQKRLPFAYVTERPMFDDVADSDDDDHRSPIELYENGKRLGPAHSKYADIKELGQGRFSHLRTRGFTVIYWSASDNSDPNTNGRAYWVVKPSSRPAR
jgi:hypothetical protein